MIKSSIPLRVLALFFLCFGMTPAVSGSLTPVGSDACDYVFSGPIENGDAQRFESIGRSYNGETICFDSEGGSLPEGQRIFRYIWEHQLKTRVENGQKCLSACAIAFLGGSMQEGTAVIQFMDRKMSANAALGFHAPSLGLETDKTYTSAQVNKAFEIALSSAEGLFRIKATEVQSVRPMTDFLYHQILRTPPSDMYYIDTIGKAVMADIHLQGLSYPSEITRQAVENICDSTYVSKVKGLNPDLASVEDHYSQARAGVYGGPRVLLQRRGDRYLGIVRDYPTPAKFYEKVCLIDVDLDVLDRAAEFPEDRFSVSFAKLETVEDVAEHANIDLASNSVIVVEDFTVPAWYMFDPASRLSDLSRGQMTSASVGGDAATQGLCVVYSGAKVVDIEPCQRFDSTLGNDAGHKVSTFVWPSGSKTVAEEVTRTGAHKINGARTSLQRFTAQNRNHEFYPNFKAQMQRKNATDFNADCWVNPSSGNTFCFQVMR